MDSYRMKILIVDDERTNLEVLCRILKSEYSQGGEGGDKFVEPIHANYELCVAKSGQAALKKVIEEKPDLILLDVVMPGMNGFEVLSELKKSEMTSNIPVIFITGLDSVEDEEKGFFLGAVDYITKPFHSSLVKARVKTHLRIVEQMRTIEILGLIDALTNIPNRRGFDNQIMTAWNRAVREKMPLSLLMIDIDNFKIFNDTYGHQQGDIVLKMVARILVSTIKRPADLAARWGGEEFAVILPNTDSNGALLVAENIRANIESAVIQGCDSTLLKVTISIGTSTVTPDINSSMSEFITQADKALYAAKGAGRNRVFS